MAILQEQIAEKEPNVFLNIENLSLNFSVYEGKVQVLDHISLEMKKGEILGIVGETGCGKTVTSRCIVRLLDPNAIIPNGKITFEESQNLLEALEKDLEKVRGRKISIVFQEPMTSLNPTMRIWNQIAESLLLHFRNDMIKKGLQLLEEKDGSLSSLHRNLLNKELNQTNSFVLKLASRIPLVNRYRNYPIIAAKGESIQILNSVEMPAPEKVAIMYPHELSGGMRQRVLIAIALACNPDLIIADEPTTAVDVTTQAKLLRLLLKLRKEKGTSILLITHNLGVIAEICDRVCVMYAGQIAEIDDVVDIFSNPFHPYTQGLMGAMHKIGDKSELKEIEGNVPILLEPPPACRFHPRCPKVMDICCVKKPKLLPIEEGHLVHCWLYQKEEE